MQITRRNFVGLGTLIACGTALEGRALFASVPQVRAAGLGFSLNEKNVLAFVRSYSANFRVVGASVLGRLRADEFGELHLIADASDRPRLYAALGRVKFAGLYAQENSLACAFADVDVTIENLSSDEFTTRLAAMEKPEGNAFAHDALTYNPETRELTDPFDAQEGGVKMTRANFSGPAALASGPSALATALRGTFEAAQFRLPEGKDFAQWKARVLASGAPAAEARKLAATFLQHLATLAGKLPASAIETLVKSRLVATALRQGLGIDVGKSIAEFKKRRAKSGAQITDAALWLAALIAPEIKSNAADGAATTWIMHGTRFQVLRSRAALAQAQTVLGV